MRVVVGVAAVVLVVEGLVVWTGAVIMIVGPSGSGGGSDSGSVRGRSSGPGEVGGVVS